MGALGDGSSDADEDEDDILLQLPAVEMRPEDAARERADHLYRIPTADREVQDEIDQSHLQVPPSVKVREWLHKQDKPTSQPPLREKEQDPGRGHRETSLAHERVP